LKRVLLLLFPVLLFAACSGTPPEIEGSEWMVVYSYDQSRGGIYKELDYFLLLRDEDGLDDISEVNIYRDDQGWSWHLTPAVWTSFSREGEDWIGSGGLTRGGVLPPGDYRAEIVDRSGQKTDQIFRLEETGPEPRIHEFPRAQVTDDFIRIDAGNASPVVIWFYNDKGDFVSEVYRDSGLFKKSELLGEAELQISSWFMLYHQNEEGGYGLKSGPYLMKEPVDPSPRD